RSVMTAAETALRIIMIRSSYTRNATRGCSLDNVAMLKKLHKIIFAEEFTRKWKREKTGRWKTFPPRRKALFQSSELYYFCSN
ncbi:hypothetical protein, partial [Gluconobacter cerinus]|uniref:hypothetical protein n=1 Tax=Gluconobacter cerinus TaxID=38307 RepID=UPI00222F5FE0